MNLNLQGKRAWVCGSTQGIGNAAAIELAKLGASITLIARNEQKLQNVLASLDNSAGQQHRFLAADFSKPETLKDLAEQQLATDQTVHILVNNTGGPPAGLIQEATIDAFMSAFQQHLVCNHLLTTLVLPSMKTANYGRIINIISTSVKQPLNGLGVSNTTRGAVANWAKTMANEVGEFGITVNNVLPGATNTVRLQNIIENKASKQGKSIEEVSQSMKNAVPAKRFATPQETAYAIAFLASPSAAYINGINLPVDGGRTKCL